MNPIQTIFANANVKGCFLCLCSNVWKHVQNVRLQVRYFEEPEFPFNSRMLTALAFLPTKDVRGFVAVCTEIRTNFGNVADELLAHFKDIYISNFRLNTPRNNPIFSKEL